ncbi:PREDICTED: uncharacterized protein LOC106784634 [Polistes canadensis]|uniref:uncharacterized protein LOC106784634 n=1 Tax=Polistes canadensis TaxID=91411 RepID=UPI000718F9CE|nr:PREDICTED: uncharacterized protein LOC106784634 [Polistes canadensis]
MGCKVVRYSGNGGGRGIGGGTSGGGGKKMSRIYVSIILGAFLTVAVYGAPTTTTTQELPQNPSILEEALDVYASCSGESDLSVCLKLKALRFVDRAAKAADINVIDGFRIVQIEEAKSNSRADNARSYNDIESTLPSEIEAKEAAIDQAIIDRASKFLSTHTIEFSLPEDFSRSLDEARGKKKKIVKSLLPILLLLKAKTAILLPLALGALALLAFKALIIGKIALIISAIIGLQKLLASKNQSYEVVAHPVHSHAHYEADHGDHHGWARSGGSDLAYSAYKPSE